jgi:hypothetical protein
MVSDRPEWNADVGESMGDAADEVVVRIGRGQHTQALCRVEILAG